MQWHKMNKRGTGRILQQININSNFITPINVPVLMQGNVNADYFASSLTTFINAEGNIFFPINLSNTDPIFKYINPSPAGNTIFKNIQTTQRVFLYYNGNKSEVSLPIPIPVNNKMLYIDNGRNYEVKGKKWEKKNYGNVPNNNGELNSYIERSDIDGFDFPEFKITGTRKIPASTADTLCGPVTYTGYTYDRSNYNWKFGENAGIDFNSIISGGTPNLNSSILVSQEGCSTISNTEGELLFFTNGETVYNSGNTIMLNGENLSSSGTSTQSSIIVPRPNSNQYYIFTTDFNGNPNGFEYSIVDMLFDDRKGAVTSKNIKLINQPVSEKVTACETHNGDGYWVITHTSGDSRYHAYKVSSIGLTGPVISNTGSTHNTARGYMKTSLDGEKIISLLYDEGIIDIADFDNSTGVVDNVITISGFTYNNGPYGLEFSSDSSKFYVSDGASDTIYQFNLDDETAENILVNRVKLPIISGASLGALQMGVDERIYVADLNQSSLHVINYPNGLGVQCNLQPYSFSLTSTTVTGNTSQWGLPNLITTNDLSCDRFIYITDVNRENFDFKLIINDVNNVIEPKEMGFTGEIYKYDKNLQQFTNSSVYTFDIPFETLSGNNINNITIPLSNIGEGEFIIKGYYQYNINTLVAKQLGYRKNTINTYKRGEEYNLYTPNTDWYFLNLFKADNPIFNNDTPITPQTINNLVVESVFTQSGNTIYEVGGLSDPIVSFNGSVLFKDVEYSAITTGVTPVIQLNFIPEENQILTYAYVRNSNANDLFGDTYTISSPIKSGDTESHVNTDRVYYNTDQNKFEFYLSSPPFGDVIMSINGSVLSNEIEYFLSETNNKRIIFTIPLQVGDIIEAFYTPQAAVIGEIPNNRPTISWSIIDFPNNTDGRFTVQFAAVDDENFENILYSFQTDYVLGQRSYSLETFLDGAQAGDEYLYRVKNEKFYQPIIGETIYTFGYSDIIKVKIATNIGENY